MLDLILANTDGGWPPITLPSIIQMDPCCSRWCRGKRIIRKVGQLPFRMWNQQFQNLVGFSHIWLQWLQLKGNWPSGLLNPIMDYTLASLIWKFQNSKTFRSENGNLDNHLFVLYIYASFGSGTCDISWTLSNTCPVLLLC